LKPFALLDDLALSLYDIFFISFNFISFNNFISFILLERRRRVLK